MPKTALAPVARDVPKDCVAAFLSELRAAGAGNLLLDYDGTLAPFTADREKARPHPEIPGLLDRIMRIPSCRVLVISGRLATSVALLLGTRRMPEIWGLHGLERINAAGVREVLPFSEFDLRVLANADAQLTAAGLAQYLEFKPGSVAVHWRGLAALQKKKIRLQARRILDSLALQSQLLVLDFAEGIELRVSSANKGDAVRSALGERTAFPTVYIGDDLTDEDAFRVVSELNGLSILMRRERRQSCARAWFQTPAQLFAFLRHWIEACEGGRR
jgi:trehalose 6-phosphate phosphatase